uniref:SFRICE_035528 n=1 Tax=Spodoptera frugiperda TaxID=7108 RepID=A0A2H1WWH9_SPOFR
MFNAKTIQAQIIAVKIAFRVWNLTPNSIPFSSFNIHAIWMQWTLVLQLKSTKFHNINVDRSELESGMGIFETNN